MPGRSVSVLFLAPQNRARIRAFRQRILRHTRSQQHHRFRSQQYHTEDRESRERLIPADGIWSRTTTVAAREIGGTGVLFDGRSKQRHSHDLIAHRKRQIKLPFCFPFAPAQFRLRPKCRTAAGSLTATSNTRTKSSWTSSPLHQSHFSTTCLSQSDFRHLPQSWQHLLVSGSQ